MDQLGKPKSLIKIGNHGYLGRLDASVELAPQDVDAIRLDGSDARVIAKIGERDVTLRKLMRRRWLFGLIGPRGMGFCSWRTDRLYAIRAEINRGLQQLATDWQARYRESDRPTRVRAAG
jgi:hypothetical protein